MKAADEAETRLPMAHGTRAAKRQRPVGEQEWVQCCNPNCGKWRALHRSMDASNLPLKEWYCVMNSWDEVCFIRLSICVRALFYREPFLTLL